MAFSFAGGTGLLHSGTWDTGTYTELAIDSAFILGTSGDAMVMGFIAPEDQTTAALTIYPYIGAVTGSPTDFRADIYAEPATPTDVDRPEGSALATSSATDLSALADSWATFSIASVSLTKDAWYWLVIRNATGTPGSNYAALLSRPFADRDFLAGNRGIMVRNGTTINGVTSDPLNATYIAACIIKMDSGTLFGNPYAKSRTFSSGTNHRGMRVIFPEDIVLAGVAFRDMASNSLRDLKIYLTGTSTQVGSTVSHVNNSYLQRIGIWRIDNQTLTGGQGYDIVVVPAASTSSGTAAPSMSEASPPADVLAMQPDVGGTKWASVSGAAAGSYTYDERDMLPHALYFDEASPAIAGGAGGLLTHPGMAGGMRG